MKTNHQGKTPDKMKINEMTTNNIWLAFVNIGAKENYEFNDLVDYPNKEQQSTYIGAWANILVKALNINDALEIIPKGLNELNFEVLFIDKIENVESLIEYDEINEDVQHEVSWLLKSDYVFKISKNIFPYE